MAALWCASFYEVYSSRQLQMIERSLMTVDELKYMPKGHFVAMKTGAFSAQRIMRSPYEY